MSTQSTGRTFNGGINVAFVNIGSYNILQQHPMPAPRHTIFAFLISTLFNFLDLQYQGNSIVNPFQTHPKTMYLAFACVLFDSFAYAAELEPRFAHLGRSGMALFGSILSVSLASVLFRNAVSLALYSLFVLFSNRELLCCVIKAFWSWIRRRNTLISENRGGLQSENSVQLTEIV